MGYMRIETYLRTTAEKQNRNVLIIRPRNPSGKLNREEYRDRRCNGVIIHEKNHERDVIPRESIAYIQHKINELQKDYVTLTLVVLAGVDLKNDFLLENFELTHLF